MHISLNKSGLKDEVVLRNVEGTTDGFDIDYESNLLNNKYNYKESDQQGLRNQSFYIVKHKELEVIDLTNK